MATHNLKQALEAAHERLLPEIREALRCAGEPGYEEPVEQQASLEGERSAGPGASAIFLELVAEALAKANVHSVEQLQASLEAERSAGPGESAPFVELVAKALGKASLQGVEQQASLEGERSEQR